MNASNLKKAVVDANVLIHSRGQFSFNSALIPPSVEHEVKSNMAQMKMQKLDLTVMDPSDSSLDSVRDKSDEINSPTSEQDEEALALAIDNQVPLITDDKALQNLALHLGAEFDSFNTEKVDEKRKWKSVCGNCGAEISTPPCPRCGHRSLHRKSYPKS
ncbi:hypothetical protein [Candidatus Nanohalobium constans]|uniref:hypothetical protein n=1 Tax=Candidatus Nanohalobium constans TaxID=2565781 RepID=UPI00129850F6|nr:hypothetical protein [Candidatus Nanohalobium constans]